MALLSPYFLTARNIDQPRLPDVVRRRAGARPAAGDPHARDRPVGRLGRRARRLAGVVAAARGGTGGARQPGAVRRDRRGAVGLANGAVLVYGRVMNPFIVTLGTLGIVRGARARDLRRADAHRPAAGRQHARLGHRRPACPCPRAGRGRARARCVGVLLGAHAVGPLDLRRRRQSRGGAARRASRSTACCCPSTCCAGCSPGIAGDPRRRAHGRRRRRRPGQLLELDAITAVIIGGASFFGGRGRVVNVLAGALIIGVIRNGLDLLDVSAVLAADRDRHARDRLARARRRCAGGSSERLRTRAASA